MNYYRRHVGDYLKDTAHLSLLEHGVYTRLLDVYYTREAPFAPGEAARLVGARTKEERAAVDAVLAEFFVDGRQGRCDREIEKYQARAAQNREVGSLGGRPRKSETQSDPKAEPKVEPKNNPDGFRKEPIPTNQEPITKKETPPTPSGGVRRFPPGFEAFWAAYPKKVGKDAAARMFARRKFAASDLEPVLIALARQVGSEGWTREGGRFIPNPATWLNEGRWQDGEAAPVDRFAGAI